MLATDGFVNQSRLSNSETWVTECTGYIGDAEAGPDDLAFREGDGYEGL